MRQKDNYVMVKRVTPKRINLPNGKSFLGRYESIPRDRLPPNLTIIRRYKQRSAPKDKRRRQGGRGLHNFMKMTTLLNNVPKRTKNKLLKCILDCDVKKAIARRGSKNVSGRISGTNWND